MCNKLDSTQITILADNRAKPGLVSEHGFSCWIESAGRNMLFDTGQGSALAFNADKLAVDLQSTDALVLSHGHYDHTGGLPLIAKLAPSSVICAHPGITDLRFSIRNGSANPISMPTASRNALVNHNVDIRWTTRCLRVMDGMGISGEIPRQNDYEDTGGPFFFDPEGMHPDPILDDLAVWVHTKKGLVVIVGCSHSGLVNTLCYAAKISGEPKIHAVLGGFHLIEASQARLTRTIDALQKFCLDVIVPCHCTGDVAMSKLKQAFGDKVVPGSAGSVFRFGD